MKRESSPSLLGILSLGPMSGYDIKKTVAESIGYFWNESYGQIYPLLKRYAAQGLVTVRTERNSGKPDRRVYALTPAGRAELARWLKQPANPPALRNELLLKLFFGGLMEPADLRRLVEDERKERSAQLRAFAEVENWLGREHREHPSLPYWMITLDYGKRLARCLIAWSDATLETLPRGPVRTARTPGRVLPPLLRHAGPKAAQFARGARGGQPQHSQITRVKKTLKRGERQ
jgi:PadR family transcriptional regulator, regulatory protein AphA